ncbi:MAG: GtrA family protein [Duncaniella sp.]|nr:GtrA family protein [Duncaniella sp.]
MKQKFLDLKDKFLNGEGLISTFLRSSVSSQMASWVDLGMSMLFYAFVFTALDPFYRSNLSVAVGAIAGGIVNCCINYRFTFHAKGQSVKAVSVKYFLVWTGSLLLNMYGTTGLASLLSHWEWLLSLGFKPDGIFAAARLTASLAVSWGWNFVLQRNFVYRPTWFDRYAIKVVDTLTTRHSKKPVNTDNHNTI